MNKRYSIKVAVMAMCIHVNMQAVKMVPELMPLWRNPSKSDVITIAPTKGWRQFILPVFNHYQADDGGYIVVYTNIKSWGLYRVAQDVYVAGMIRVRGSYHATASPYYKDREFVPYGREYGQNINHDKELKKLVRQYFHYIFYLKSGHKDQWDDSKVWVGAAPALWDPEFAENMKKIDKY